MMFRIFLASCLTVGLLVGCNDRASFYAEKPASEDPYNKVNPGMSEAEAVAILGQPLPKRTVIQDPIQGKQEMVRWTQGNQTITLLFVGGKIWSKTRK
jgi:hypothetical protein